MILSKNTMILFLVFLRSFYFRVSINWMYLCTLYTEYVRIWKTRTWGRLKCLQNVRNGDFSFFPVPPSVKNIRLLLPNKFLLKIVISLEMQKQKDTFFTYYCHRMRSAPGKRSVEGGETKKRRQTRVPLVPPTSFGNDTTGEMADLLLFRTRRVSRR